MKKRKHSLLIYRVFCFIMALHVINVSIDTRDRCVIYTETGEAHEDLSINDMESFVEFFVEDLLGMANAIPEHDDPDEDSDLAKLLQEYCFSPVFRLLPPAPQVVTLEREQQPESVEKPMRLYQEITSPPPRQTA